MKFRPTFWLTVATTLAFALLMYLGWWQVERLQWKTALIAELEIRAAAPAIPLPSDRRIGADDLVYRTVTVTGHYLHESEMHVLNRVRNGIPGIHLFTPLQRDDGEGYVLINRGWVPMDWEGTPVEPQNPDRRVEVTGVVRVTEEPGWLTPENQPGRNQWYHPDMDEMAAAAAIVTLGDFYVFATGERGLSGKAPPAAGPVPNEWKVALPNNHLVYAITWFSLGAVLVIIYLVFSARLRNPEDG